MVSCRNQMAQHMKTGKYAFKRGIIALYFGEKCASLHLRIIDEPWWTHWGFRADYCLL